MDDNHHVSQEYIDNFKLTENEQGFIRYLKDKFGGDEAEVVITKSCSLCVKVNGNVIRADDTSKQEAQTLFPGEHFHWTETELISLLSVP